MPVATGARARPMRATMGPMAAGGRTTWIHLRPAKRMMKETRTKAAPAHTKPPTAFEKPSWGEAARLMQLIVGAMNAKLEPRKAGAFPRQMTR